MPGVGSVIIPGANNGAFLALPGVAGNYASSPNATPLQITGDITIDVNVALANWANGTQVLGAKRQSSSTTAYYLAVNNAGQLDLAISTTGSDSKIWLSSVAIGLSNGARSWVRASLVLSTGVCQFFTSSDGVTWTQLGTNQTLTATAAIFNSTSPLEIGSNLGGASSLAYGAFYEAKLYASALGSGSGTPVFDANFTTKAFGANSFAESSTNAATVTVNGTAARLGDGRNSFRGSQVVQAVSRLAVR
jgi:hypothetical protein